MTLTDQTRTKTAYALQWNRFRILRPDEDRATFRNRTGLSAQDLAGKTVLDGGCGMGRYLRIAAEMGPALAAGIDLSLAVQAARELTEDLPGVAIVRGDLLRPPFPPESFDHVYSIGVLDHTPDPRRAFLRLAALLKPGGRIAIWVYRRTPGRRADHECPPSRLDTTSPGPADDPVTLDSPDRWLETVVDGEPSLVNAASGWRFTS